MEELGLGLRFDEEEIHFDNDSLPAQSVMESVNLSNELPNDLHEHILSNENLKDEICTICLNKKTCSNSYICNLCPLKICDQCASQIIINSFSKNKHEHELSIINEGNCQCNKCQKDIKAQSFHFKCKKCKFNLCLKCYYPSRKEEEMEENNSIHVHPLEKMNLGNEDCSICGNELKNIEGFKCYSCPLVLCKDCEKKVINGKKRTGLHEHKLYLTFRDIWECDICQSDFRMKASFHCSKCLKDYCDECFIE